MKDNPVLSEAQLADFRSRLLAEQSELAARLKELDRKLSRNDAYNEAEDLGDSAVQVFNKEEILFERNRVIGRISEVELALQRITDGTYGISRVSGKPIPLERLQALPTATTLVDEEPPNHQ